MKIYYGWWIVLIAAINMTLICGATFSIFGLFVLPVSKDFNLSRADTNTALILVNFGSAIAAPFVGRLFDRLPIRRIIVICALTYGACFIILGLSHSLVLDAFVLFVPLGIALVGAGTGGNPALVARWFNVHRGRALALAAIGVSLGGLALGAPVAFMIEAMGWRKTMIALGVAIGAIILVLSFFMRNQPGPNDIEDKNAQVSEAPAAALNVTPLKVAQVVRMPQFWLISLSIAMFMAVAQAFSVTVVPLTQGLNFTTAQVATLMPLFAIGGIGGKLFIAWIGDRADRVLMISAVILILVFVNIASMLSETYAPWAALCAVIGFCMGSITPLFYALLADRFGAASFGTVNGLSFPLMTVFAALLIRFSGEVYDRTGNYDVMFAAFMAILAVSAALMFANRFAGRPKLPQTVAAE